jgi:hypothetical protein
MVIRERGIVVGYVSNVFIHVRHVIPYIVIGVV